MADSYISQESLLTNVHLKTLQKCQREISRTLNVNHIIDACYQEEILTRPMMEEIKAEGTPLKCCQKFLAELEKRSIKAFNSFIDVLKDDYSPLATTITKQLHEETLHQATIILGLANDIVPIKPLKHDEPETTTKLEKIKDMTQQLMISHDLATLLSDKARQAQVSTEMGVDNSSQVQVPIEPSDMACQVQVQTEPGVHKACQVQVPTELGVDKACQVQVPSEPGVDKACQVQVHTEPSVDETSQVQRESLMLLSSRVLKVSKTLHENSIDEAVLSELWSLTILSTGDYVMSGRDKVDCAKALLFDNQMNEKKTLVAECARYVASTTALVAVSCTPADYGRVRLFDLTGEHLRDIKSPSILDPWALAFNKQQELIIADGSNRNMSFINTTTGKVVHTSPCKMFDESNSIAVNNQNNVIIADYEDRSVKTINRQGGLLSCYRGDGDHILMRPRSVCVDSAGNIIIADSLRNNIQLLSPEGNFKKILMSESDGLRNPFAVALNCQGDLVIGTRYPPKVYVVKNME